MMKNWFTLFVALFCFQSFVFSQEKLHSETELLRTIPIEDECQPVVFMLYGDIAVEEWENKYMQIKTNVYALNFGENLLEYLVASGRYNLKMSTREEDGALIIEMPKRELVIMKRNANLEEHLEIHIYVPKGLIWELVDPRSPFAM